VVDQAAPWVLNDATHNAFLDRVARSMSVTPHMGWVDGKPPADWLHFRSQRVERERAGRERFGFAYLERDNIKEGVEENCDSDNYNYMDLLQAIHRGESEEWDLVLTIAYHDFMSYRTRLRLRERRRGSP
jgi:hypothetical protein